MKLDWALAVATYNRREMLLQCVECALRQTVPPSEIVIIDASSDATESKQEVADILGRYGNGQRFVYEPARIARQTAQRNQALEHTTASIAFMIDDDTLMFPRCAERVLSVYERDHDHVVAGVIPLLSQTAPVIGGDGGTPVAQKAPRWSRFSGWLNRKVKGEFWPPDARPAPPSIPPALTDCRQIAQMHGARLTVRTEVAKKCRFDEHLVINAHEDSEASYRFQEYGCLLELQEPLMFHASAPRSSHLGRSGSLYRAAWLLNHAYLCAKLCRRSEYFASHIVKYARGTLLLDAISGARSFNFAKFRGGWFAMDAVRRISNADPASLPTVYSEEVRRVQAILRGERGGGC